MISGKPRGIHRFRIGDQGTKPSPGRLDIFFRWRSLEISRNSAKNIFLILFSGLWIIDDSGRIIRGSHESLSIPRKNKDNSAVLGTRDENSMLNRRKFLIQNEMRSRARLKNGLNRGIVHL